MLYTVYIYIYIEDGSARLYVDCRGLNKSTIKNKFPLPILVELLDQLNGTKRKSLKNRFDNWIQSN